MHFIPTPGFGNISDEKKKRNIIRRAKRNKKRSLPIGGARQNAAPFNFTISADVQSNSLSLLVILPQTVTELFASMPGSTSFTHYCAVLNCIFAADPKQLVT